MTAPAAGPSAATTPCREKPVPSALDLDWEQYAGRSCCACGRPSRPARCHAAEPAGDRVLTCWTLRCGPAMKAACASSARARMR